MKKVFYYSCDHANSTVFDTKTDSGVFLFYLYTDMALTKKFGYIMYVGTKISNANAIANPNDNGFVKEEFFNEVFTVYELNNLDKIYLKARAFYQDAGKSDASTATSIPKVNFNDVAKKSKVTIRYDNDGKADWNTIKKKSLRQITVVYKKKC